MAKLKWTNEVQLEKEAFLYKQAIVDEWQRTMWSLAWITKGIVRQEIKRHSDKGEDSLQSPKYL